MRATDAIKVLTPSDRSRFWRTARPQSGCWEWQSQLTTKGYARFEFHLDGKRHRTQGCRLAYLLVKGPIPRGFHVLHRCDNRKCVKPGHLFLGTNQDNIKDCISKGRWGAGGNSYRFSDNDVRRMRRMREEGRTYREIADVFGTNYTYVWQICKRRKRYLVP